MKNTFGQSVAVTLFGESHGPCIGATLDGLAPGIAVDTAAIRHALSLRRPGDTLSTARREPDDFQIVSGVRDGFTTGAPLTVLIPNTDTKSDDYAAMRTVMRPAHADFPAQCKYHGFQETAGGGHFSGRVTAALVAAGAICVTALQHKNIRIGTHIARCAGIADRSFENFDADFAAVADSTFPVLDTAAAAAMQAAILAAKADGDSVGGVLETAVTGLPAGVGEPWFDTVESMLSHMLFAVPAVKGVEFGDGFALAEHRGSTVNDALHYVNGQVVTATNHNGGIGGGITNGMPVIFRCAVKPTPSISLPQQTVDIAEKTDTVLAIRGRHDPAIVHRVRAVVDAVTAMVLCDLLCGRYGTDWLAGGTP